MLLVVTILTASFFFWIVSFILDVILGTAQVDWRFLFIYLFTVGPTLVLSAIYKKAEPTLGLLKSFALCHVYVFYAQLWGIAGWKALWRELRGQRGWTKTERVAESKIQEPEALESKRKHVPGTHSSVNTEREV